MPNIRPPRDPRPTGDVKGPNEPANVDPGFNNPYRDTGGDTVGAGDWAGRKPVVKRDIWGYPIPEVKIWP